MSSAITRRPQTAMQTRSIAKHQVRHLRIGFWSSHVDSSHHKEMQRRHRVFKQKYAQAINQKLAWDRQAIYAFPRHWGWQSFVCGTSLGGAPKPDKRNLTVEDIFYPFSKREQDVAVDQNYIDKNVDRDPFVVRKASSHERTATSPSWNDNKPKDSVSFQGHAYADNDIDPITNRRVQREFTADAKKFAVKNEFETPVKTFKGYRDQFQSFAPPSIDTATNTIHLDGKPGEINETYNREEFLSSHPANKHIQTNKSVDTEEHRTAQNSSNDKVDISPSATNISRLGRGERAPSSTPLNNNVLESSLNRSHQAKYSAILGEGTDRREDLDLLRASDVRAASGIIRRRNKESETEKVARRQELEDKFSKAASDVEATKPNLQAMQKKKYESQQFIENLEIECSELKNHVGHARGRVNAILESIEEDDVAVPPRKITGNFVRDFPEEFETTWTAEKSADNTMTLKPASRSNKLNLEPISSLTPMLSDEHKLLNEAQGAENRYAAGLAPPEEFTRDPSISRMETSLERSKSRRKAAGEIQSEVDTYLQEPAAAKISSTKEVDDLHFQGSSSKYGLSENGSKLSQKGDKELIREVRSIYEEKYGTIDCQHRQPDEEHPFSHAAAAMTSLSPSSSPSPTSTLYKIIAYDPSTHEMMTSTTTSSAPPPPSFPRSPLSASLSSSPPPPSSSSSSSSPAAILPTLAHPARFLPLFPLLERQGFELASGSGNVVCFRQVRDVGAAQHAAAEEALLAALGSSQSGGHGSSSNSSSSSSSSGAATTAGFYRNPIDGMVSVPPPPPPAPKPATANFASPTGFVNHDVSWAVEAERPAASAAVGTATATAGDGGGGGGGVPAEATVGSPVGSRAVPAEPATGTGQTSTPPPPPPPTTTTTSIVEKRFVSGIDVRREEPVFSGRKTAWRDADADADDAERGRRGGRGGGGGGGGGGGRGRGGRRRGPVARVARRVVFSGVVVAACSYAAGVVSEFFRTGGSEGVGAVGF